MNLKMPVLARVLEDCGFSKVRTLLSSGNAVFDARGGKRETLEQRIEAALRGQAGRAFNTFVRTHEELDQVLARTGFAHPAGTKRIVVLLRQPMQAADALPIATRGAALLGADGTEAWGYYTPGNDASAFMARLQRRFGPDFTTRTVDTVRKCRAAAC